MIWKERGKVSRRGWMLSLHLEELRVSVKPEITDRRHMRAVSGHALKRAAGPR